MENIQPIVDNGTCTQCGMCEGVCPHDAISFFQHNKRGLIPQVDENKCTKCKICVKVCPGEEVDFKQLNKQVFGKEPTNELFGNYNKIFTSYAYEKKIRYNGASGGVVTAMLDYLLSSKQIDGAVVVRMSKKRPLEPEIFIATNLEELISAQQSKYLPVPAMKIVKEIQKNPDKVWRKKF